MICRDEQACAAGWVEAPLEYVPFYNQRVGDISLDCALAFGANVDEYCVCLGHGIQGLAWG